jgi:hypothetical protein
MGAVPACKDAPAQISDKKKNLTKGITPRWLALERGQTVSSRPRVSSLRYRGEGRIAGFFVIQTGRIQ